MNTLNGLHLGRLLSYLQTLDSAKKILELFTKIRKLRPKKFYNIDHLDHLRHKLLLRHAKTLVEVFRCQFYKHFTLVTYNCNKICLYILKTRQGSVHSMHREAYFARPVSYKHKMFMKSTTGVNSIKLFFLSL